MFVDLEGLKERSLVEFLKDLVVEKKGNIDKGVILAVDNDAAGQKFVDKLSSKYQFTTRENYQLAQPYRMLLFLLLLFVKSCWWILTIIPKKLWKAKREKNKNDM